MTESTNPETPRPSGDQPRPINPDAVKEVREAGGLITNQESLALAAASRGRIPSVPSDPAIGNQNSSSHASGQFDMTNPMYQMTDDGDGQLGPSRRSFTEETGLLNALQRFFGITK